MNAETATSDTPTQSRLLPLAARLFPELRTRSGSDLASGVADVVGFLYALPLALAALGWLIAVTDVALLRREWPALTLMLALVFLLRRFGFVLLIEIKAGSYFDWNESMEAVVSWSAALLFGPMALWLIVLWASIRYVYRIWRAVSAFSRWNLARNFVLQLADVLAGLVALWLYRRWGGVFPLPGLAWAAVWPALGATCVRIFLPKLVWLPVFVYYSNTPMFSGGGSLRGFARYVAIVLALPGLIYPFAILAAGLYVQLGLGPYLFFIAAVVLAGLLAHRLSEEALHSHQRSRELEKLEQLGRAIIEAPPDESGLSQVLSEHIPGMFLNGQIEICVFPDHTVLHYPGDWSPVPASVWQWLRTHAEPHVFAPEAALPWGGQPIEEAPVVVPILDAESGEVIGGIYVSQLWNLEAASNLLPAVQTLAAQVASALHRAEVLRVEQELALAGRIQASFLPRSLPQVTGWQIAAALEPARETSGDFYDVIPLPNGRLGLVVADVAGKGMGAALVMALARTLIRTYAAQYHARPDFVLRVANRRILMDTDADLFVTVFYGVLDPITGHLTYCNAGHNPPFILTGQRGGAVQELRRTGIPLGVFEAEVWEHRDVQLAPGDTLFLYSDGVTDTEDGNGDFFGPDRLLQVAQDSVGRPAKDAQDALLAAVRQFAGDAPQFDDITVMVITRDGQPEESE